jgi:hypothetical protein
MKQEDVLNRMYQEHRVLDEINRQIERDEYENERRRMIENAERIRQEEEDWN